ncbi:MAG: hypothetical protein O2V44_05400, partial [Candidatus Bathyarchaeota archaeon]|nr:hypothetical protein [Candidatus Bathyarchaeota archaeon]
MHAARNTPTSKHVVSACMEGNDGLVQYDNVYCGQNPIILQLLRYSKKDRRKKIFALGGFEKTERAHFGVVMTLKQKTKKSEEEWRKALTPEEFHVLREKG